MIFLKIQGGVGNQLFQWAYAYKLSKTHEVYIDKSLYDPQTLDTGVTKRDFILDTIIKKPLPHVNYEVYQKFKNKPIRKIVDSFCYEEHDFKSEYNYYIDGYWQSEKYFHDAREEIVKLLNWPSTECVNYNNSCSIHVRRGDYLKYQNIYHIPDIDYYNNAIEIINPPGNIFIFSDDIQWCEHHFKSNKCIFIKNDIAIQDLRMMSLCTNHIIANSSFSWWGAWLNQNKNKIVVAPRLWFANDTSTKDLIPRNWIII